MYRKMNLRLFEDGKAGGAGSAGQGNGAGNGDGSHTGNAGATYSYEQAEEIANARAGKAERAALANYFRSQGMTEEEITTAISDFKAKRQANKPDVAAIEKERDDAKKELESYKQKDILKENGVDAKYTDFVLFEVSKKVDDKTDFKTALKAFLKDNPHYAGSGSRVNTQTKQNVAAGSGGTAGNNTNDFVNSLIRKAARR